jgi:methyl-accepting chemotaxis protein
LTVGKKLMASVLAMMSVVLGITFASLYSLGKVGDELEKSTGPTSEKLALAGDLKATANIMRTGQRGLLLNAVQNDEKGLEKVRQEYAPRYQAARAMIARMKALLDSDAGRELAAALESHVHKHASCFQQIVELCTSGKIPDAFVLYREKGAPAGAAMEKTAGALMELVKNLMKDSAAAGHQKVVAAWWTAVLINIAAMLLVGLIAMTLRRITRTLRKVAVDLSEYTNQITSATAQIASTSQSLAQEACEQAAAIEETSAASQEVTSMIHRTADNSKNAAEVMETVDDRVTEGNRALDHMVASMEQITSSSDKIAKIIKAIDEIAFQTNILALNAAVEAARAGDAGMGFAVVADEVRNLAQRSAQAARDTAALIEDSIAKSKEGGSRLEHVARVVRSITESASKVKVLVDEVSLGTREQAVGVEEISKSVIQMEQVTQTAAAHAEESASACEEIAAQTQSLHDIAGQLESMVGISQDRTTNHAPRIAG